jgi:hypothetical protein
VFPPDPRPVMAGSRGDNDAGSGREGYPSPGRDVKDHPVMSPQRTMTRTTPQPLMVSYQ